MITKAEALERLFAAIPAPGSLGEEVVSLHDSLGRVLAENVAADMDAPPFDRSAMDGFAVSSRDFADGAAELEIVGTIAAGDPQEISIPAGACVKIMTGAPVPADADAVVMVERSDEFSAGKVRLKDPGLRAGQNIAPRGQDMRDGETVLRTGTPIRPIEVGMLATLGCEEVAVYRRPAVAVVSTGDELVPLGQGRPGPGRIRESNGYMLAAQVADLGAGIEPRYLGIAKDEPEAVKEKLDQAFEADVVILSGGVSMGEFDYVHRTLEDFGLEKQIEKVSMKPGKPLLFGRLSREGRTVHVFGLPGNPVSSHVTFELFVRPFLRGLMGYPGPHFLEVGAILVEDAPGRSIPRTQHLPARVAIDERSGALRATAIRWHGSGDLRGLLDANGFVIIDAGAAMPKAGSAVQVLLGEAATLRLPPHPTRS